MDQKGIATADLLFATLIAIVIMASMVSTIGNEVSKSQSGDLGTIRVVGEKVAETVNIVYTNGNGYAMNLTLTNVTNSSNYTIGVSNGGVLVNYQGKTININTLPKINVTSVNMTQGKKYLVKNNNGTITFTLI
ncbi:MAG: hypothetical protein CVV28_09525 [Methanobacteriales archaeon HGW-Methanobacteriales-1]|jgi:hypothetical protein|nr:MAG: hypothetical protein CVV28_09525 [Methanobacteriales archaeon HGW-Methanobacteriales-1]